jgi:hypothetical protein
VACVVWTGAGAVRNCFPEGTAVSITGEAGMGPSTGRVQAVKDDGSVVVKLSSRWGGAERTVHYRKWSCWTSHLAD